jgi:hypothetical protein
VTLLKRAIALWLSLLVSPLPAFCGSQHAGQINALIPSATRNEKPTQVKEGLDWNDLLKTQQNGRVRAGLVDGSILSVGSNSELRVVQHDAASQQTSLEMNFGRLRSRVVKITQPNGKFEVKTPNAVIGVVGTDFYVEFSDNKTTVICYSGQVMVTPQGSAHSSQQDSSQPSGPAATVAVLAGQMVEVTSEIPPGGYMARPTSADLQQASIETTNIPDAAVGAVAASHAWHYILFGAGFAGLAVGLAIGANNGGSGGVQSRPGTCPPNTPPSQCP